MQESTEKASKIEKPRAQKNFERKYRKIKDEAKKANEEQKAIVLTYIAFKQSEHLGFLRLTRICDLLGHLFLPKCLP